MTTLFIVISVLIAAAIGWLATLSGEYHVLRKRTIKASPEALFETISDLKTWPDWTPWLAHEPDAQLDYSNSTNTEGSWYSWDGKIIGAGKMMHNKFTAPHRIESRIEFTRPMSSGSDIYWTFEPVDEGTEVTWGMRGEMPFLFRWLAAKMDQMIGKDYEIGLNKLAMVAGDDSNPFGLSFEGIVEAPAQHYISTPFSGTFAQLPDAMQKAYSELMDALETHKLNMAGEPFALYHTVNPKKDIVVCDIAVPLSESTNIDGFSSGLLPARRYSRTLLRGEYKNLQLAWYSAFSHLKMSKLKFSWKQPMLERYIRDSRNAEGIDLVTYLDIPLK